MPTAPMCGWRSGRARPIGSSARGRASRSWRRLAAPAAPATPAAATTPAAAAAPVAPPASAARVELLADDAASPRAATTPTADITLLSDTLVARTEPAADADAAFQEGRYAAAAAAYIAALGARPDDPGLHHRAAVAAALAGDFVTAEHHAGLALRLDPGNASAADLTRIAYAHQRGAAPPASADRVAVERALRDGRLRTAARLAEAALAAEAAPADRLALLHLRGRALLALGRADEAFAALKAAAALQPPSADLWGELATAARLRGDHDAADALRRIAARIADPAHPLADARPTPQNEERP
jgi:tetratricopeptide (TPR) repeat protein